MYDRKKKVWRVEETYEEHRHFLGIPLGTRTKKVTWAKFPTSGATGQYVIPPIAETWALADFDIRSDIMPERIETGNLWDFDMYDGLDVLSQLSDEEQQQLEAHRMSRITIPGLAQYDKWSIERRIESRIAQANTPAVLAELDEKIAKTSSQLASPNLTKQAKKELRKKKRNYLRLKKSEHTSYQQFLAGDSYGYPFAPGSLEWRLNRPELVQIVDYVLKKAEVDIINIDNLKERGFTEDDELFTHSIDRVKKITKMGQRALLDIMKDAYIESVKSAPLRKTDSAPHKESLVSFLDLRYPNWRYTVRWEDAPTVMEILYGDLYL